MAFSPFIVYQLGFHPQSPAFLSEVRIISRANVEYIQVPCRTVTYIKQLLQLFTYVMAKPRHHDCLLQTCCILTNSSYTTGFCSIASGVMPVPTMMLPLASLASIRRCCCYGGKVARNTRKSTKVVQHTPDEWFSKEQFSANPNWVFFSKEV